MATKAYLTEADFEFGKEQVLRGPECSQWLSERLLERLASLPKWKESKAIRLGSWARGELTPKSDVDLLLLGDEADVREFVATAQKSGIKIRSRLPENPADWTVGVEPFDVLALLHAKAFDDSVAEQLKAQQKKILARKSAIKKIVGAVRKERLIRQRRHDSVSNYLEPNLKFGAGGLRDLEQALVVHELFAEKFSEHDTEAMQKIVEAKNFLLMLRQMVHWLGGSDILAAGFQPEIARLLGYSHLSELMKEVQIRLERGSFYADWVVEHAMTKEKPPKKDISPLGVIALFTKSPSIINQYFVRRRTRTAWSGKSDRDRGAFLKKLFSKHRSDVFWIAIAKSLFLEECLPDLKKVKGITQHDHYHRYTVETHLYQTIRETDRFYHRPQQLFSLKVAEKDLSESDWVILRWTALFHDLGKGRNEDHSTVGAELVRTRLKKMGIPAAFSEEVEWLVTNHLLLTTAAFRQNANQPSTWKRLFERGVSGARLTRLIIFSAIDIRATNPEAWTSWKARLLSELFLKLKSPTAISHQRFFAELAAKKTKLPTEVLNELDTFLIEALPRQVLVSDLKNMADASTDLPLFIKRKNASQLWVRFHRRQDRPGLFLEFVQKLFWSSARIDAASVTTLKPFGVYDWFLVRTSRTPKELTLRLSKSQELVKPLEVPKVAFQSVEMVSDDQKQWVLSFRGRDQKGLLLAAANALYDLGLAIHWARVHTWGSQIDDVFCVEAKGDLQNHLALLREKFVT
jgi:[protein-PII] uridylyltransferase